MAKEVLRKSRFALPALAALELFSSACGAPGGVSGAEKAPAGKAVPAASVIGNLDLENELLNLPFAKEYYGKIKVQQGWNYLDGKEHKGIDFILGDVDKSDTWKSFPVLASTEGRACIPEHKEGKAVLVRYSKKVWDADLDTYYGHLKDYTNALPSCSEPISKWVAVKRGEKIGEAGSTGAENPKWVHLHFQVNTEGKQLDPLGFYQTRNYYPQSFNKIDGCGSMDPLFNICYNPKYASLLPDSTNISNDSLAAVLGAAATAKPVEAQRVTNTPKPIDTPRPSNTPKPTNTPTPTRPSSKPELEPRLTIDQKAQEEVLKKWFHFLNTEQKEDNNRLKAMLKTEIIDIGKFNNRPIRPIDMAAFLLPMDSRYLKIKWTSETYFNRDPLSRNRREYDSYRNLVGEAEIRNILINIGNRGSLSSADELNKIEWKGSIRLTYDIIYRASLITDSTANWPSLNHSFKDNNWAKETIDSSVTLQNGRWMITEDYRKQVDRLKEFYVPFDAVKSHSLVFYYLEQCSNPSKPCTVLP